MNNDDKNKIRRRKVNSSNDVNNNTSKKDYKKVSSKSKPSNKKRSKIKIFGMLILFMLVVGVAIGSALVFSSLRGVETITKEVLDTKTYNKTILTYSDGSILAEAETANKKEPLKSLNNKLVKNALVAIEDARFYEHNGVDIKGLLRSLKETLLGNKQGGSTIPMQVSKLLLTSQEQTLPRKIKDIYYAFEMSKTVSKDDILLTYLNNMYVGNSFYGIEVAARGYFNKSAEQLELAEAAMLVGATNNPSKFAPYTKYKLDGSEQRSDLENKLLFYSHVQGDGFDDPTEVEFNMIDKLYSWGLITDYDTYSQLKKGTMIVRKAVLNPEAVERAKIVLNKMKNQNMISENEYNEACKDAENVKIEIPKSMETVVSTVEDYVFEEVREALINQGYTREEANNLYYNGGLQIQTTIDPSIQAELESQYNKSTNFPANSGIDANGIMQPQSAMVILDHHSGEIKALIGGRNIKGKRTLNRATNPVQPGSAIKPLSIYTAAIDTIEMTQSTVFSDIRGGYKFKQNQDWNPSTTTAGTGNMSLRLGLAKSSNPVAIKTAESLADNYQDCVDVMIDYLKNFGITTVIDSKTSGTATDRNFPALTLGGMAYGISPLEMASAYAALANGGVYIEPTVFTTVSSYSGELIVKANPSEHRVVSEDVAYVMTDMLKAVVTEGTGKNAAIGKMPVAGKTGTTNNRYCVWFVGYTPYYVGATYIGDDPGRKDPNGNVIEMNSIEESSGIVASLWSSIMGPIHQNLEVKDFTRPSGINFYKINLTDGGIYQYGSNAAFIKGTSPGRTSSQNYIINNNNNGLNEDTPTDTPTTGDGNNPPPNEGTDNTENNTGENTPSDDNTNTPPIEDNTNTPSPDPNGGTTTEGTDETTTPQETP